MRISTNMLFDGATSRMTDLQASTAKLQEQLASGKRIQTPADDPIAAAQIVQVSQAKGLNDQYTANRVSATNDLSSLENTLSGVTETLQNARLLTITGGNGVLTPTERSYLATELEGHLKDLLGYANTQDTTGNYMFSGYRSGVQSYSPTDLGATYNGDSGVRELQVGAGRKMVVSVPGNQVFDKIRTGNGVFQVSAGGGNTGTGTVSTGSATDPSAITGESFALDFSVVGGVTTYDVRNTTSGAIVSTNNSFTKGSDITVSGMTFNIKGDPASGDTFSLEPSRNENMFTTVQNLITALRTPGTSPAATAKYNSALANANQQLSNALDNVLNTRATVGSNLKALSTLDDAGLAADENLRGALSDLQDVDYVKAISDLSKQQGTLQAAQQSFVKISGLSLFDYIR